MNDPAPQTGQAFLTLHGKIGEPDLPALRRHVSAALAGQPHDLIIDLRGVWELCDDAVALLAGIGSRQRSCHRMLTLVFAAGSATDRALHAHGDLHRFTTVRAVPEWTALTEP